MSFNIYNPSNVGFYNTREEYDLGDEQHRDNQRQYQQQMEEHSSPSLQPRPPWSLQPMSEFTHLFSPQEEASSCPPLQPLRQPKLQQPTPLVQQSLLCRRPLLSPEHDVPLRRLQPSPQLEQSSTPTEYILPMEQLRQPRLQRSSPEPRQPSPQPRQPSPQQVPPTSREPSPAHCSDFKDDQQSADEEMQTDCTEPVKKSSNMNNPRNTAANLVGVKVKKLTKREWRRRQNMHLRRILTPKNALIVLNEVLPGEKGVGQFKVEPAQPHPYHAPNAHLFRAELTVDGVTYKGYGHSKLSARNDVAEQVFRDLILKHMFKLQRGCETSSGSGKEQHLDEDESGDEEEMLPMIQLASFALHKLFAEWECGGHKVPQLRPFAPQLSEECEAEESTPTLTIPRAAKPRRPLPTNATAMHPCMLLTHLRPDLHYRELVTEDALNYTMAVDLDGLTYVGRAASKRDARKEAARAACAAHFGVKYDNAPGSPAPAKQSPAA